MTDMVQNPVNDRLIEAHDILEDEHYADHPRGIEEVEVPSGIQENISIQGVKITTSHEAKDTSPIHESGRGASLSTNPEHASDSASVQSLPLVSSTTQAPSLYRRPSTAQTADSSNIPYRTPPSSPSRNQIPQDSEGHVSQQQRGARHRSAIEVHRLSLILIL